MVAGVHLRSGPLSVASTSSADSVASIALPSALACAGVRPATRVGTATVLVPVTLSRYTTSGPISTPRWTTSAVSACSRLSTGEATPRSCEWSMVLLTGSEDAANP